MTHKTTIYTAYHQPSPLIEGVNIQPIHVGRMTAAMPLRGMVGDDTGETISDKNTAYCELTALYWAWKNDSDSDYIGLMHYRRMLDLTDRHPSGSVEHSPDRFEIADWVAEAESWIASDLGEYDIVVPRHHKMGRTVEANYKAGHKSQDFDLAREVIAQDHPDYLASFNKLAAGYNVRLGNMSIMARPLFDRYCAWLFDILSKVEGSAVPRDTYTPYQGRYLGFLAERLMSVFVAKHAADLRIKEVSILNLSQSLVVPSVTENMRVSEDSIAIAFASDRQYLPHAAAMVHSVLQHADPDRPIDFIFLASDLGPRDVAMMKEVTAARSNVALHVVDVGGAFKDSYRSASRAPSNATYNRFLLFELLSGFDRLIYLDADTIVRTEIGALFDTDMGSAEIGGATDWIMTRTLTGPTPTADPETPDLCAYHRDVLGLSDAQIARYFNAGVLVFNFAAMDDVAARGAQLMSEVVTGRYMFRDQDILNKVFKKSQFVLDARWNVFNTGAVSFGRVPAVGHKTAMAAKADPWIIHYADRDYKPWDHAAVPLSQYYWQSLICTPFYGEVLRGKVVTSSPTKTRGLFVETGRKLSERFPVLKGPLLRVYALARRITKM